MQHFKPRLRLLRNTPPASSFSLEGVHDDDTVPNVLQALPSWANFLAASRLSSDRVVYILGNSEQRRLPGAQTPANMYTTTQALAKLSPQNPPCPRPSPRVPASRGAPGAGTVRSAVAPRSSCASRRPRRSCGRPAARNRVRARRICLGWPRRRRIATVASPSRHPGQSRGRRAPAFGRRCFDSSQFRGWQCLISGWEEQFSRHMPTTHDGEWSGGRRILCVGREAAIPTQQSFLDENCQRFLLPTRKWDVNRLLLCAVPVSMPRLAALRGS